MDSKFHLTIWDFILLSLRIIFPNLCSLLELSDLPLLKYRLFEVSSPELNNLEQRHDFKPLLHNEGTVVTVAAENRCFASFHLHFSELYI